MNIRIINPGLLGNTINLVAAYGLTVERYFHRSAKLKALTLSVLVLFALPLEPAYSQIEVPLVVANTFANSTGGSSLFGISLGPNTDLHGVVTAELDYGFQAIRIQIFPSNEINPVAEHNSDFNGTISLTRLSRAASGGTQATKNLNQQLKES